MANRHTLAVSKLDPFKEWLAQNGWQLEQTKGYYEVVRATKLFRAYPLIVYQRLGDNGKDTLTHLTVLDRDADVLRAFIKSQKSKKRIMR